MLMFAFTALNAKIVLKSEQKTDRKIKKQMRSAKMYYGQQNWEKMVPLINEALKVQPDNLIALYYMAEMNFILAGENSEPEKYYLKARDFYNKTYAAMQNPEYRFKKGGKLKKFEAWEKDVKLKAKSCWIKIFNSAINLSKEEKFDEAINKAKLLAEATPDSTQVYNLLSSLYMQSGREDEGLALLIKIADENPDNVKVLEQIAVAFYNQNKLDDSAVYYEKLSVAVPDNFDYAFNAGVAYTQAEKNEKALSMYEKAYKIDPENITAIAEIARIASNLENAEKAIKFYAAANKLEPKNIDYIQFLIYQAARIKDWQNVYDFAKKWHELDPQNAEPVQFLFASTDKNALNKKEENIKYRDLYMKLSK